MEINLIPSQNIIGLKTNVNYYWGRRWKAAEQLSQKGTAEDNNNNPKIKMISICTIYMRSCEWGIVHMRSEH